MRPEVTRNFLDPVPWHGWYTPPEKRRLKRAASKASRATVRRVILAALLSLLASCSPADWAAVDAAGAAARVVACVICGESTDARAQAAKHAKALRDIFEAVSSVAEAVDPITVAKLRAELQASHERERAAAEKLLNIAARAKPVATPCGPQADLRPCEAP